VIEWALLATICVSFCLLAQFTQHSFCNVYKIWGVGNTGNNNTNNTNHDDIYGAEPLREFTRFIWRMQTERPVAANPQTKPTNLGCESTDNWQLPSTSSIAIYYYYSLLSPKADTHLIVPWKVEGWVDLGTAGRMQQPLPKTAYHNGCRDKRGFSHTVPGVLLELLPTRRVGVNNLPKVVAW